MKSCRRRAVGAAQAAILVLAALPASGADRDPAGPAPGPVPQSPGAKAPEDPPQREIDAAVERGVKFLRAQQDGDGGFGTTAGETGLALWALRHCGVPKNDPAVVRAAARLERDIPDGNTYGTSLGICGLLAHDLPKHRERIQKAVDALVRGQCDNGQWSYLCKGPGRSVGDNSNTQCAALALGAAKLRGLKVPAASLQRLLEFAVKTQNEDGGWGYSEHQASKSYGSMTAGVLMCWLLGSGGLAETDPRKTSFLDDDVAKRALSWLGRSFIADANPGDNSRSENWKIYWLWSVERAGVLGGFERLGRVTWYPAGAKHLLARQTDKGGWTDERTLPDTCWALLFLRRGTTSVITPRGDELGPTTPAAPPADASK